VVRVNTTLSYVLTDHLGSSSVTLDSNGVLAAELRYYAYGETRVSTGSTPTERLYTGQLQQDELGLDYFNARWYHGALGRFLSADIIVPGPGNTQAFNRYAYSLSNPIKYTDPTGHRPCGDMYLWECDPGAYDHPNGCLACVAHTNDSNLPFGIDQSPDDDWQILGSTGFSKTAPSRVTSMTATT
jgi:RHS repeat-associated protein